MYQCVMHEIDTQNNKSEIIPNTGLLTENYGDMMMDVQTDRQQLILMPPMPNQRGHNKFNTCDCACVSTETYFNSINGQMNIFPIFYTVSFLVVCFLFPILVEFF